MSKLVFIGVVLIAAYCSLAKEKGTVETLLLDNVEALASGEGGHFYWCTGQVALIAMGIRWSI